MGTRISYRPTFGRYLLLKRIAVGGMAEVYRAMSCGTEGFRKLVAIKRMLPQLSGDPDFVHMFTNEAKLVANLNYPNIVQIYDFGRIENQLYHSMEYVHGKNLAEIIQALQSRGRKTPVEAACHILSQVLYGLEQAHNHRDRFGKPLNIIHRDMSPQNILVSYSGEVKLADFGIAKVAHTTFQTAMGIVKGKFRYMSPEQAWGKPLDQRTDLFSVAVCFCEFLTQSDMFFDLNEQEVLRRVREVDFIKPREINPDIPKKLESIVIRALKKDREDRYTSAAEFRDALENFLEKKSLRLSSSSQLSDFMRELFADTIQAEQQAIAEESQLAEEFRPEPELPSLDSEELDELDAETDLLKRPRDLSEHRPTFQDIPLQVEMDDFEALDRAAEPRPAADEEADDEPEPESPFEPDDASLEAPTDDDQARPELEDSIREKPLGDRTTMRDMPAVEGDNGDVIPLGERPTLEMEPYAEGEITREEASFRERPTVEMSPLLDGSDGEPDTDKQDPDDNT